MSEPAQETAARIPPTAIAIQRSALWAAYGDALGFITEFASRDALRQRHGIERVVKTIDWEKSIGGRIGLSLDLPAGTYSDDTQLRLSTSRAIRGDGKFDVEVFAKIELPVWPAYALGGGRGTKAAAASLMRSECSWATNFFNADKVRYTDSGGNGAAMRIQPHIWSARASARGEQALLDIARNTVTTHGHPRALAGAVIHGLILRQVIVNRAIPDVAHLVQLLDSLRNLPSMMRRDEQLRDMWLGLWARETSALFDDAFLAVVGECHGDVRRLDAVLGKRIDAETTFRTAVDAVHAFDRNLRGAGTKTALLSWALALLESDVERAVQIATNTLGSDTDTIASMTGALLGVVADRDPTEPLLDREYIVSEAHRMAAIASGGEASTFAYPDLLHWAPPRTQSDALFEQDGRMFVLGLGPAQALGDVVGGTPKQNGRWQWVRTDFGQSLLIKRREELAKADKHMEPVAAPAQQAALFRADPIPAGPDRTAGGRAKPTSSPPHELGIEEAADIAADSGFDPSVVGGQLLQLARGRAGLERSVAYAALIARTLRLRTHRGQRG